MHSWLALIRKKGSLVYYPVCAAHLCINCYGIFHCAVDAEAMKPRLKTTFVKEQELRKLNKRIRRKNSSNGSSEYRSFLISKSSNDEVIPKIFIYVLFSTIIMSILMHYLSLKDYN